MEENIDFMASQFFFLYFSHFLQQRKKKHLYELVRDINRITYVHGVKHEN